MNSEKLMERLLRQIEKKGKLTVLLGLGYKSESTINKWISKHKIPPIAQEKVEKYLKGKR